MLESVVGWLLVGSLTTACTDRSLDKPDSNTINEFTNDQLDAIYHFIRVGASSADSAGSVETREDCPVGL